MITNKLNLNQRLYDVISSRSHEPRNDGYSVTELLNSTRDVLLNHRHYNDINEDVVDLIPALFGSAVHKMLESEDEGSEERLETEIYGKKFIGVIDLYHDGIIEDYKTTSATKVQKKDFEDHRKQVLMYAWLKLRCQNIRVKEFKINYLIKDWSKVKASTSTDYPQSAFYCYEDYIQDSDIIHIEEFIFKKFKELIECEKESDSKLPECSDEERWYTGTKYAVYKNPGDKRALKVFDTMEEASQLEGTIIERPGQYLKCDLYCKCKKFCSKYKSQENDDL